MMAVYSHVRRQALDEAAFALAKPKLAESAVERRLGLCVQGGVG
jgi:hypothetical protein